MPSDTYKCPAGDRSPARSGESHTPGGNEASNKSGANPVTISSSYTLVQPSQSNLLPPRTILNIADLAKLIPNYDQWSVEKKQWERPPIYNVKKLSRNATHFQVSDWIDEISTANALRDADEDDKAYWASTHLEYPYAADWRSHMQCLERHGHPVDQEAIFQFVKGEHLDADSHTIKIRDALISARQRFSESPEQFHSRWRLLHIRLGHVDHNNDPHEAHQFFRKLLDDVQTQVLNINPEFPKTAAEASKRATLAWHCIQETNRIKNRKQARQDKYPSKRRHTESRKNYAGPSKSHRSARRKSHKERSSHHSRKHPSKRHQ